MLNKILLKKIKFPLSLRGAKQACPSESRGSNLKGFSLIELMVAVVILALAVLGIFQAYSVGFMGMADARDRTVATNYAQEAMENIKNMEFEYIASLVLAPVGDTKFSREVQVIPNFEGSANLKKIIVRVFWKNRNGKTLNIETSMLVNKIEFIAGQASRILLYVQPYNVIYPAGDVAYLTAVVKDAKGNTLSNWDKDIKFTVTYRSHTGEIDLGYLEGGGDTVTKPPNKGIATTTFYAPNNSKLGADDQGLVTIRAESVGASEIGYDTVDIIITWGAVRIDMVADEEKIKINNSTTITAYLVNAKGEPVTTGEAEIIFSYSGDGTLSEPLVRQTEGSKTTITLNASSTPGIVYVTASANNLIADLISVYVVGPPKYIFVSADPNYIYRDETSEITVLLQDVNHIEVEAEIDVNINLSLTGDSVGQGTFNPSTITIFTGNSIGNSIFSPTSKGSAVIQAVDSSAILTTGQVAVTIVESLIADHIVVSAKPSSIKTGGDLTSTITAVIKNLENITVVNYSDSITFATDKGNFIDGSNNITLTNADYQNGVASVVLYANKETEPGIATITVTSSSLNPGNTEVVFYIEPDHIVLTSNYSSINIFGKIPDTCSITAEIKDILENKIESYIGTVTFKIIDGGACARFTTAGDTIATVVNGTASVDLYSRCDPGNVEIEATSDFAGKTITSNPYFITVTQGNDRSITLVSFTISSNKKGVGFNITVSGGSLKIYNLRATWGSTAKLNEVKINGNNVYIGSISDGEIINVNPTVLTNGTHNIYFTYSAGVGGKNFNIIFNADPDCEFLTPIIFTTP